MVEKDINAILVNKNINCIEKLIFNSEDDELQFISKINKLVENNIEISIINNDLKDFFEALELNEENLKKLRKIIWKDFNKLFLAKNKDKISGKVYDLFISFLKTEFNLIPETLYDNKKKENFDINADSVKKAKKYGIEVLFDYTHEGGKTTVNDFILYFNKRLQYFTDLIKNKINIHNLIRISRLQESYSANEQVAIIGLISEIEETQKGHLILTVEDKSGKIKCFINQNKLKNDDFKNKVSNLCLDEGIGIIGKTGDKIIWVDDLIIPSPLEEKELKNTNEANYIVCLGDIHVGSKLFVDEAFQRFSDWINGLTNNAKLNKIAEQVKYIIIPGDMIEGLGVYPGQKDDVNILSTKLQYNRCAQLLSQIPKDKCIIIIPGNHDVTRMAEPQTKLSYDEAYSLYNMENVIMLSNPSIIKLFNKDKSGGLDFYLYHGGSLFYYADKIQTLRDKGGVKNPNEIIKFLLEKRHLAPSHGATLYIPDSQQDPLIIKEVPDFFITGHTHKMGISNYKGCSILSCGCWNLMSNYQEKMGMYPDVGKCILINTKTRKTSILNFHTKN